VPWWWAPAWASARGRVGVGALLGVGGVGGVSAHANARAVVDATAAAVGAAGAVDVPADVAAVGEIALEVAEDARDADRQGGVRALAVLLVWLLGVTYWTAGNLVSFFQP